MDRVAAAIEDLRQDLRQTQQDLVMCLCSASRNPVLLLSSAEKQSASARTGVNCRPGLLAATGETDDHNYTYH